MTEQLQGLIIARPPLHPCVIDWHKDPLAYVEQYLVRCRCHVDAYTAWRPGDPPYTCPSKPQVLPEHLAQRFHETYERLAPQHGYETRRDSAVPWAEVPEQNRRLMIAVCAEILGVTE